MMKLTKTKENWLHNAVVELATEFKSEGLTMPKKWRISSGFPSKGGLAAKKRTIGQCWSPEASGDKTTEIIISITQDNVLKILGVVAHEMVHAVVGIPAGHRAPFKKLATSIGLEGKMTTTTEGPEFIRRTKAIIKRLGKYPHAALDHTMDPKKKQSTRMIKVECVNEMGIDCGMIFRTSSKWANENTLKCPRCEGDTIIG
jgi:hypothetical protein